MADQMVPTPSLYWWKLQPLNDRSGISLRHLSISEFIYRISDSFTAHILGRECAFSPAMLQRESFGYQRLPIRSREWLITPEAAERALDTFLTYQHRDFWASYWIAPGRDDLHDPLGAFRKRSWQSLCLEHLLQPGIREPSYKFRKTGSRHELWVGAYTSEVQMRLLPPTESHQQLQIQP